MSLVHVFFFGRVATEMQINISHQGVILLLIFTSMGVVMTLGYFASQWWDRRSERRQGSDPGHSAALRDNRTSQPALDANRQPAASAARLGTVRDRLPTYEQA